MAVKLYFSLALVALVAVVASADDCNCELPTELENTALWTFLSKLSSDLDVNDEQDKELHAVLPGELSPLVECNCLEKNRRKRKTESVKDMSESAEHIKEVETQEVTETPDEPVEVLRTPKCPRGFVWFGFLCVDEQYIMDK